MILSFPYLVVILTTLGTPKNIFCVNNIMNDNSKQNKTTRARTSLIVLYLRNYAAGIHGHYHESSDHFEYPKKSILKSSHPKKYLPNLHTQKNPGSKISNPKKSFDHPRHLKSGVPPLGQCLGRFLPRYSVFCAKIFRYRVFCIAIILGICYQRFCIFKVYWYPRGKK